MVRTYKRKSDRQKWSKDDMENAINEVISGTMCYKRAANTYNVPQSTLEDRVKKKKTGISLEEAASKGMGNFKCVFSTEQEAELVEYVKDMESRLFGLTTTELRRVAFQLAERNHLQNTFNTQNQTAGLDWLKGFLRRHPDLSLRSPEPTSAARAMGFNQVAVGKFFDLLTSLTDKHKFRPTKIYNVDETGLTTVPKSHSKVIAMRDRRQVGTLASGKRGQLVTAVLAFSAAGHYIPPFLIFPRVRMKAELLDGAPAETAAACHPSGWMQSNIFVEWMIHFIKHAKPFKEDPVLVLLDGHATHTKNIDLIDLARQNGIILLCFPPRCTHKLQPLDVSFMAPLSTFYSQEVKTWLHTHPGRVVTQYQIGALFGLAYNRAATIQTAVSGFRKTGIYPLDKNIFDEVDFAPTETTEREDPAGNDISEPIPLMPSSQVDPRSPFPIAGSSGINLKHPSVTMEREERSINNIPQISALEMFTSKSISSRINPKHASTNKPSLGTDVSADQDRSIRELTSERPVPSASSSELFPSTIKPINFYKQTKPSSFSVSPTCFFFILAIPHRARKVTTVRRVRRKTAILTDSPYKNELEQVIATKKESARIQLVKRKVTTQKGNKNKKSAKQTRTVEDTSSEEEAEYSQDDKDTLCIYCKEQYSRTSRNDGWVKCTNMCSNWAHEGCIGWLEEDLDDFICQQCELKQ